MNLVQDIEEFLYKKGSFSQDLITCGLMMVMTSFRSGESEYMTSLMHGHVVFLAYFCMSLIITLAISTFFTWKLFASGAGCPSIYTPIKGQKQEIWHLHMHNYIISLAIQIN